MPRNLGFLELSGSFACPLYFRNFIGKMGGTSSKEASAKDARSSAVPASTPKPVHDENEPLPREKLPKALQKIVDSDDDSLFDQLYDGRCVHSSSNAFFLQSTRSLYPLTLAPY